MPLSLTVALSLTASLPREMHAHSPLDQPRCGSPLVARSARRYRTQTKHASRQDHARRRERGPQGRFLGAADRAKDDATSAPVQEQRVPRTNTSTTCDSPINKARPMQHAANQRKETKRRTQRPDKDLAGGKGLGQRAAPSSTGIAMTTAHSATVEQHHTRLERDARLVPLGGNAAAGRIAATHGGLTHGVQALSVEGMQNVPSSITPPAAMTNYVDHMQLSAPPLPANPWAAPTRSQSPYAPLPAPAPFVAPVPAKPDIGDASRESLIATVQHMAQIINAQKEALAQAKQP